MIEQADNLLHEGSGEAGRRSIRNGSRKPGADRTGATEAGKEPTVDAYAGNAWLGGEGPRDFLVNITFSVQKVRWTSCRQ